MPRTLVMDIPKIQYRRDNIVQEAKIEILVPQNFAKDYLSDDLFKPNMSPTLSFSGMYQK